MSIENAFLSFVAWIVALCVYFLPSTIASVRGHHNSGAIFLFNMFFGCSGMGWLVALIWAATAVRSARNE